MCGHLPRVCYLIPVAAGGAITRTVRKKYYVTDYRKKQSQR